MTWQLKIPERRVHLVTYMTTHTDESNGSLHVRNLGCEPPLAALMARLSLSGARSPTWQFDDKEMPKT